GERARRLGDERGVVEAERMADQEPRVEIGRIESAFAQPGGGRAADLRDRRGRGERRAAQGLAADRVAAFASPLPSPSAASSAAWCSVISASMISLGAGPSMICGSL